jgi:hypothetical protein
MVQGQGQVRISPVPAGYAAAIDGVVVSPPAPASEGLHLVQVGPAAGPMAFASVFHLPAGDTFFVLTGMETTPPAVAAPSAPVAPIAASQAAAPAAPPGAARLPAAPRHDRPGWLIPSSAAAAALAVTSALLAVRQDAAMEDATTLDDLDTAYDRQRGWAWTSYGSMGLTVVSIGLYFAL